MFDRGEVASVVTNDTFESDIGEDIKGVIVEKLRHWATNGDVSYNYCSYFSYVGVLVISSIFMT